MARGTPNPPYPYEVRRPGHVFPWEVLVCDELRYDPVVRDTELDEVLSRASTVRDGRDPGERLFRRTAGNRWAVVQDDVDSLTAGLSQQWQIELVRDRPTGLPSAPTADVYWDSFEPDTETFQYRGGDPLAPPDLAWRHPGRVDGDGVPLPRQQRGAFESLSRSAGGPRPPGMR